jgi:MFS family permease
MEKTVEQRRYQNFVVVAVCITLVAFFMAVVQYKVPTIMISLMGEYEMDAATGSWLMSIFTLVMVFAAIPSGALMQKIGPRKVAIVAVVIMVCGSVIGAFAPNATVLLASRAIEGVALTAMTTCGPVLVETSVAPERKGGALGIWGVWGSAASVLAALITPTLFLLIGKTMMWFLYAAFVVAALLIMLVVVKPVDPAPAQAGEEQAQAAPGRTPRYRDVFTRDTLLYFVGFVAFNITLLAVLGMLPSVLQLRGMDPTLSGFVTTLPMLISIVSGIVFGNLLDKTGKLKFLLVLTVGFLGPCTFIMYTQEGILMWVGAVLMGVIGLGSVGLMIAGFLHTLEYPELATIGMGVLVTVQGLGQFLGTFLVQALLGPQLDNVFLAGGFVMVFGLVGALCLALCRYK